MDISWGEADSSGPSELGHSRIGTGEIPYTTDTHTDVQFYQLQGPGAFHLFGRISTEAVIMRRVEPGLKGWSRLLRHKTVPLPDPGGEDAVVTILTPASGTLLISVEAT